MRIDQRGTDRRSREQTEIARSRYGQTVAQRRAGCDDGAAYFRIAVRGKIAKTDTFEIVCAPALLMGEIVPLASQRAHRTRERTRRAKREIVGKVEEMTGRPVGRRQMPLQPKQLRDLHLRRD